MISFSNLAWRQRLPDAQINAVPDHSIWAKTGNVADGIAAT
jgi:hypothetical protein